MSGPRLKLLIDGTNLVEDEFKELAHRATDATPVMREIQKSMLTSSREVFATEGAAIGDTWEKDTEAWIERKKRKGWDTKTERRRGDLLLSLTIEGGGEFGGEVRKVHKTSTVFGTNVFYAIFQMHKRRLMGIVKRDKNLWGEWIVDWILSGNKPS